MAYGRSLTVVIIRLVVIVGVIVVLISENDSQTQ